MSEAVASTPGPKNPTVALFAISVLGLFLELVLIRWLATEFRVLAYLQNVILVTCFLGLGLGAYTCRGRIDLGDMLKPVAMIAIVLVIPQTQEALAFISGFLAMSQDFPIWDAPMLPGAGGVVMFAGGLVLLGLLLALVWDTFVPVGRVLGRLIDDHPRTIYAYSVNVVGSLVGTWLFVGLSALSAPPFVWMLVLGALALPFSTALRRDGALLAVLLGAGALASHAQNAIEVDWTPYQKLVVGPTNPGMTTSRLGPVTIYVNHQSYQEMLDLSPAAQASIPDSPELHGYTQYDLPFRLGPAKPNVLVVGAGSGNDVAAALRNGAQSVAAVEIDPAIQDIGKRMHPEHPYDSPLVHVELDDARAFLANTEEKFDVIVFGLLDSHTTTSGATNTRLDHYIYTQESFTRARERLAPDGIIVLSFLVESARQYIGDRIALGVRTVFQQEPIVMDVPPSPYGRGGFFVVAGDLDGVRGRLANDPHLAGLIASWAKPMAAAGSVRLTTDDWPYLYLDRPRIPLLFGVMGAVLVALYLRGMRTLGGMKVLGQPTRTDAHLFFLGAAFMLLETQNISKACVALGSTWWVTAVIISGVLVMVLLANLIAARFPRLPSAVVYTLLLGSCAALYAVDVSRFVVLPFWPRAVAVGLVSTIPLAFSGIVFVRALVAAERKDRAFGANMLGSLVGGLLQAVTFLTGTKALLLIVLGLYTLALLTRPRTKPVVVESLAAAS